MIISRIDKMNKEEKVCRRRRTAGRMLIVFMLLMVSVFSLSSCGKDKDEEEGDIVFTFAKNPISLGEVYIYAETVREDYELTYGKDVWNMTITLLTHSWTDGTAKYTPRAARNSTSKTILPVQLLFFFSSCGSAARCFSPISFVEACLSVCIDSPFDYLRANVMCTSVPSSGITLSLRKAETSPESMALKP